MKNQPSPPSPFHRPAAGAAAPAYKGIDVLDPFHRSRLGEFKPPSPPRPPRARLQKTQEQIGLMYELGLTSAAMSFHQAALDTLREVTEAAPDHAGAWRALADLLPLAGQDKEADAAKAEADRLAGLDTPWRDATGERSAERLELLDRKLREKLEKIPDEQRMAHLRDLLFADPLNVVAMRYLSNGEDCEDDSITALNLLKRALALSPTYLAARIDYAKLLHAQRDHLAVLQQTEIILAEDPDTLGHRIMRADSAVQAERFDLAVALYESILKQDPNNPHVLNSYGSVLKTLGRRDDSVRAFRTLLSLVPDSGNGYFGLSELKANYLTQDDVVAMRAHLAKGITDLTSRKCLAYALGQTLERARDYEGSFKAYSLGADACREEAANLDKTYYPEKFENRLHALRSVFSAGNMAQRAVAPSPNPTVTPIFIVGMPRAGSTLVEQILASHSLVEGTRELPVIMDMTKKIALSRAIVKSEVYPQRVLEYSRAQLDALGQDCLNGIAAFRKTTLPYVIDKRPWNWLDACFIHLILPQAKFIDVRRAPMAAGFAMFKQLLPLDACFSFDLGHLGHYYRSYVSFMDHVDDVMPGRVLRVFYPDLVNDTETQIRRMLDYCGLPFEEGCLRFWETDRAVMTPSAEQVRRPIFKDALEQWRNFEPWLGPLKDALGDLAED